MTVHDVAAAGFQKEASTYAASRPTYPPDAVAWIAHEIGLKQGMTCVDLAAGTGIFTRLLSPFAANLITVEPISGMRAELLAAPASITLPPCASAVAEALPFAENSLDAVTIAQAFHWFDAAQTFNELRRCVRTGGHVAMLWNARLRSFDWVNQVWGVMDRVEKHAPWRNHDHVATNDTQAFRESDLASESGFDNLRTAQFTHVQTTDHVGVVARVKGVSHVAVLPADEQAQVLDEVREILANHPQTRHAPTLEIPYRVDCYAMQRN